MLTNITPPPFVSFTLQFTNNSLSLPKKTSTPPPSLPHQSRAVIAPPSPSHQSQAAIAPPSPSHQSQAAIAPPSPSHQSQAAIAPPSPLHQSQAAIARRRRRTQTFLPSNFSLSTTEKTGLLRVADRYVSLISLAVFAAHSHPSFRAFFNFKIQIIQAIKQGLYLMERVLDDESEKRVLAASEDAGLFTSGGFVKDMELKVTSRDGPG
ncbi:hypothetical protein ACS0TY_030299 [Phlomoides rotata]